MAWLDFDGELLHFATGPRPHKLGTASEIARFLLICDEITQLRDEPHLPSVNQR
jgi:hypothetical protein